jgi:hypothetical protein
MIAAAESVPPTSSERRIGKRLSKVTIAKPAGCLDEDDPEEHARGAQEPESPDR